MRQPTIWVADHVRQTPGCTATEAGKKLEISDLERKDNGRYGAKTKALISCAVTAQLICAFVFAYADCWFSDVAAQLKQLIKSCIFTCSPLIWSIDVRFCV